MVQWNCQSARCPGTSWEDARKLQYALDAAEWMEDPFGNKALLDNTLFKALLWQAGKSPEEIMQFREDMVSQIEFAAEELRLSGLPGYQQAHGQSQLLHSASGKNDAWLKAGADEITYPISKDVSGFLLQELVHASGHCDPEVAELFRKGTCSLVSECS